MNGIDTGTETTSRPVRECELIDLGDAGEPLATLDRVWRIVRGLIKARRRDRWSLWDLVTALLDRIGLTLQTVQVLCIDRDAARVLILITDEYDSGLSPVQALRKHHRFWPLMGHERGDARLDARTELGKEAVVDPPPPERFMLASRYREGIAGQFACRVFVVECRVDELKLRPETAQGMACWAEIGNAIDWLDNPELTRILHGSSPAAPVQTTSANPDD